MPQQIEFYPLSFVPEGDDVVVGRAETGSYAVLPVDGAELLRRMVQGTPPELAAAWYFDAYHEPVDLDDFLVTMADLGFIRTPDDAPVATVRPRLQWLGRALFSAPAWAGYVLVLAAWLVIAARHHDIRPAPSDVFFTRSLVITQAVVFFGQIPMLFVHEMFHVLAGQRIGLVSRLNVSNRYTFVVFETQSNGLLSRPRQQRYLVLLAGLVADVVVFCGFGIVADLTRAPDGSLSLGGRLCLALAFTVLARIGWQFLLYLRTDLYFVLATAANCYDLHAASTAIFWNRIWRALGKTHRIVDESQWTDRDRRLGRWYGWVLVFGLAGAVGLTCWFSIPVLLTYLRHLFAGLFSPHGDALLWDSVFSLLLNVAQFGAPAYLARRKRRFQNGGRKPRLLVNSGV